MTQQIPPYKNVHRLTAAMTPEMCKAIRRQETNAGIDYLKHAINNDNIHPTFRRLTQVNLDFPGIYLPNVNPTQSMRSKRRQQRPPVPMVLSRSKTSVMPEIKAGSRVSDVNTKVDSNDASRKPAVTDITCQQLADTLLSYNNSPFSGLFGTAVKPSRYEDYHPDENNNDSNPGDLDSSVRTSDAFPGDRETPSVVTYQTIQSDDRILSPRIQPDMTRPSEQASHLDIVIPQGKPQKSILKNGNSSNNTIVIRPNSATCVTEMYNPTNKPSVFSYQLPNSMTIRRSSSEATRVPSASMYPKIQNDLPVGYRHFRNIPKRNEFSGTVRNIPIRIERQTTVHGTIHDRKRSVRFNAAHQVHEYTPCEPVRNC